MLKANEKRDSKEIILRNLKSMKEMRHRNKELMHQVMALKSQIRKNAQGDFLKFKEQAEKDNIIREKEKQIKELKSQLEEYKIAYLASLAQKKKKIEDLQLQLKREKEKNKLSYLSLLSVKKKTIEEMTRRLAKQDILIEALKEKNKELEQRKARIIFKEREDVEEVKRVLLAKLKEYRKKEPVENLKGNEEELKEKIEKLKMQIFAQEEEYKILEKENMQNKEQLAEKTSELKMLKAELDQEKRNIQRKESYFPLMIRLSEEDANNRISRLVRENVKREAELEKEIVELKEKIEEQARVISKMRQAERDLFLSISKFVKEFTSAPSKLNIEEDEELIEIEAMVKNAIEHNHNREQIKSSLINSGYKKESVEKVLNHYL